MCLQYLAELAVSYFFVSNVLVGVLKWAGAYALWVFRICNGHSPLVLVPKGLSNGTGRKENKQNAPGI